VDLTELPPNNAAAFCGAIPQFVDVEPATACLSPARLEERLAAGFRPKLVVPVHFAGLPCDLERFAALAERFGFGIVEARATPSAPGTGCAADGAWWGLPSVSRSGLQLPPGETHHHRRRRAPVPVCGGFHKE
jgi:hypothetical protein